jgi:DAK2 domain fusion protein YloV
LDAVTHYNGDDLVRWFTHAAKLLEENVRVVNELNVFPVPDGDTGTNMFLTLRETVRAAASVAGAEAGEVAAAMFKGALSEARGNSGMILSQLFKGIAIGSRGRGEFGMEELASMLETARGYAYQSVGEPVEGTMLTVMTHVAESARAHADRGDTLEDTFDSICAAAASSVAQTPSLLPILREAGVVDAGGHGLSIILEGVRRCLRGEVDDLGLVEPPPFAALSPGSGSVSEEFLRSTDEELYGYCTQFLLKGEDLRESEVRRSISEMALSTVVIGDETSVKVHVHAQDPGPIISYAASLGTLSEVTLESMDEQHREYTSERRGAATLPAPAASSHVGVVAVAWGDGLESVFSELGVSRTLQAGDTMNPSVREILEAVEGVDAEQVVLLPNNRNIIAAARQAIELCSRPLWVVQTSTIPEGVAAMFAFNPEMTVEDNVSAMEQAIPAIRTGEICRTVRSVELSGVRVQEGQIIGLMGRELRAAGDEPGEVLISLLRQEDLAEGDLVTLYWGEPLAQEDAESTTDLLQAELPGVEVELVRGGQPHYHYIVSVE